MGSLPILPNGHDTDHLDIGIMQTRDNDMVYFEVGRVEEVPTPVMFSGTIGGIERDGGVGPLKMDGRLGDWSSSSSSDITVHTFDCATGVDCPGASKHGIDDTQVILELELLIYSIS
jgi:hypothetical protein